MEISILYIFLGGKKINKQVYDRVWWRQFQFDLIMCNLMVS